MLTKAFTSFLKASFNPGSYLSLHNTLHSSFARRASPKPSLKEKLDKQETKSQEVKEEIKTEAKPKEEVKKQEKPKKKEFKKAEITNEHRFEDRMDPRSPEIDDEWMSKCYLNAQNLPKDLLQRCHQVFSKFPHQEVRKMGLGYIKLYQFLHASEKPTDLSMTKPFANTEELVSASQAKIYLGKKRRYEDEASLDEEEKAQRKKEKQREEEKKKAQEDDVPPEKKADQGIVYDQNTALAFLQRKMPHTFGVSCRILTELKYRLPDFEPKTCLDFGAGLGSASYAFKDVYRTVDKIVAIEPAPAMRKLGKFLTQDVPEILWFDSVARIINVHDLDGLFDVVFCGYVLEEIQNADTRKMIIESLWTKVRPGGVMILIEPGSPKGFRFVHDFRQWIVDKSRDEANIVAPCPHHNECPMAKPKFMWCNFEQTIAKYPNAVFAKLPQQETIDHEKFIYLTVRKGKTISNKEQAIVPADRSFFWDRIIKKTLKRKGHIIIDVCNTQGALERIIVARSHGVEGGYKHAKKVSWGDLWNYPRRIPNKFRKESQSGERLW